MKGTGSTGLLRCCCFLHHHHHQNYPAHNVESPQDTVTGGLRLTTERPLAMQALSSVRVSPQLIMCMRCASIPILLDASHTELERDASSLLTCQNTMVGSIKTCPSAEHVDPCI